MSVMYAAIPFLNVIFTYGMETAYFRFSNKQHNKADVFHTSMISLLGSTVVLTTLLILLRHPLADLLQLSRYPEFITLSAIIIGLDALTAIPFAKLRQDERPVKYAMVRIGGILLNIAALYFFVSVCPKLSANDPDGLIAQYYRRDWAVGYVLLANLIQAAFTALLLLKEFQSLRFRFNVALWKEMMLYSAPLIIAGFGGMINETLDRIMLLRWVPAATEAAAKAEVGTYSAVYKLSILITLAVQAFRMGAEPFFFKQASSGNAPNVYARVMKFFVITLCIMFLFVMLYLDVLKYFIQNPDMYRGLHIVPILLFANIFLGIYYNLSIWYKLSNKTSPGAWITIIGAVVTIIINYFFIPRYGFLACAWAHFFCYGSMMVISYFWGQNNYPVPYNVGKLSVYMALAAIWWAVFNLIDDSVNHLLLRLAIGTLFLLAYIAIILYNERRELGALSIVGKRLGK